MARISSALTLTVALVALALLLVPASASARNGKERLDRIEQEIISLVNVHRAREGVGPLAPNRALARSADAHSFDMLRRNYFSHTSPSGSSMQARVARFTHKRRIGETLGYEPGRPGGGFAARIVDAWLASPSHRAAILSDGYSRIGVAKRLGRLGSRRATVVTANLSSRR